MKSKFIFMALLLSLLLNICHDFLIEKQIETSLMVLDEHQKVKKISSEQHFLDLHEIFHFSALISKTQNIEFFSKISSNMIFVEKVPPQTIIESSFKPPRT